MKNTFIVYKHTNLQNGKIYIGITKYGDNPNKRWRNGYGYNKNDKFFSDIVQYGWNNFNHEILAKNLSEKEALQIEKNLIKYYNCIENGYNISPGGNEMGEESRKKISEKITGIKRNPESIKKQLKTKYNRYHNLAGQNNITSIRTKRVRCKETGDVFASISEANNWANTSKVGLCCNGLRQHAGRHPLTNEQLSWEFVNKEEEITIREEQKRKTNKIKKVLCKETNIIYANASEASRITGVTISNILRVCKGERKTAGNLHWSFIEEEK